MSDPEPVVPQQWYTMDGPMPEGVTIDVTYYGPNGERVERDVDLPYDFIGQEGETHASHSIRVEDVAGEPFYIDDTPPKGGP